jgi:hypothetical protein
VQAYEEPNPTNMFRESEQAKSRRAETCNPVFVGGCVACNREECKKKIAEGARIRVRDKMRGRIEEVTEGERGGEQGRNRNRGCECSNE